MNAAEARGVADAALARAKEQQTKGRYEEALHTLIQARQTLLARQKTVDPMRFNGELPSLKTLLTQDGPFYDELRSTAAVLPLICAEFHFRLFHMAQGPVCLALMRLAIAQAERFGLPCSQQLLETMAYSELLSMGFVLEDTREQALKRLYQHETLFPDQPRLIHVTEIREAADWKEARLYTADCMRTRFLFQEKDPLKEKVWEGRTTKERSLLSASLEMAAVDSILTAFEKGRSDTKDAECWVHSLLTGCELMKEVIGQVRDESQKAWGEEILAPWVEHALFAIDLDIMKGYVTAGSAIQLRKIVENAPIAASCPSVRRLKETLARRQGEPFFSRLFGRRKEAK